MTWLLLLIALPPLAALPVVEVSRRMWERRVLGHVEPLCRRRIVDRLIWLTLANVGGMAFAALFLVHEIRRRDHAPNN